MMDEREQRGVGDGPAAERGADVRRGAGASDAVRDDEGVLTLVCFKCGTEYYYAEGEPPAELKCGKCGNTVFRTFVSALDDEAADDFEEATARDLHPDDAEGDSAPGDVLDLNRG